MMMGGGPAGRTAEIPPRYEDATISPWGAAAGHHHLAPSPFSGVAGLHWFGKRGGGAEGCVGEGETVVDLSHQK
jgi:hypothetical protein